MVMPPWSEPRVILKFILKARGVKWSSKRKSSDKMSYFWQFLKRAPNLKFHTPLRSKSSLEFENLSLKGIQDCFS